LLRSTDIKISGISKLLKSPFFYAIKKLICYIHRNPVYHNFTDKMENYKWSSYLSLVSIKSTNLQRENVLGWFDNVGNFKIVHNNTTDFTDIADFIIE